MQIRSTFSNPGTSFMKNAGTAVTDFVADNPYRTLTDLYDASMGSIAALNLDVGAPTELITGANVIGGIGHTASAIYNAVQAADSVYEKDKRQHGVRAAGDALIAAGMFMSAAGVGPLSLGFLGTGLVTATISETL